MTVSRKLLDNIRKRHTAIIGQTRSGKTYAARHILKGLQENGVHTVFFDPKHDDEYADLGEICTTPMQFYSKLLSKCPAIVYRPTATKNERSEELTRTIDLCFNLVKKPGFKRIRRVFAIDEVQLMVKKGSNDGIEKLWTVGAGQGILGMAITQRIQLLNETIWSQSENKLIFKVEDRPDYLRSRNLDHYVELMPFFQDPKNQYWYYATVGDGKWVRQQPIGAETSSGKSKSLKRLRVNRW